MTNPKNAPPLQAREVAFVPLPSWLTDPMYLADELSVTLSETDEKSIYQKGVQSCIIC